MRLLLVEDDPSVAISIELMLRSEGFNVHTTDLGEDGVDLGKVQNYDAIVLDLNLPDISGYDVLFELRRSKVETPILILSGLANVASKVKGLGFGADDYLTKPFHKEELIARVHAVMRRSAVQAEAIVHCGDLVVKLDRKRAEVGGREVDLTKTEYDILQLLAVRQGATISKEMFLNHLYGGRDEPNQKIIDVFICKLRKKLAKASGGKDYIDTIWGRGWVLREPPTAQHLATLGPPASPFVGAMTRP